MFQFEQKVQIYPNQSTVVYCHVYNFYIWLTIQLQKITNDQCSKLVGIEWNTMKYVKIHKILEVE